MLIFIYIYMQLPTLSTSRNQMAHTSPLLAPTGSKIVMVTATTEVPTLTEVVLNGITVTVTTVVPTTTLVPSLIADKSNFETISRHTSGGTIAGAVVGATAGFAILVGGIFFARKRYKKGILLKQRQSELDNEDFYADPYQQGMEWNNQFAAATGSGYHPSSDPHIMNPAGSGYGTYAAAQQPGVYLAPQQQMDEYDEYGHPRRESFWSSLSDRFRSIHR
ncbi:uncharacterized protein BX663DRAFT_576429 [Cokeromyces recurvatus]|uniref:uncharacterized protein n=1 Tax=Cokeromyces recurvatus TaxID=90255 RepID=UPI002220F0B4|nr:uncharacterized protein BX663DRAFT_576429 [Cokeromyces recurvatus]KAI7899905.1 hypothetical protein BX663DRAFT_576429 [Cokeromyces recurvatus]